MESLTKDVANVSVRYPSEEFDFQITLKVKPCFHGSDIFKVQGSP